MFLLCLYDLFQIEAANMNENVSYEDFEVYYEETGFNQKFVRRYFKVKKNYGNPYDILIDIKEGNLDRILEGHSEFKDLVRVCVQISSEKVNEKGEIVHGSFNAVTDYIEQNEEKKDEIIKQLHKNMLNRENQQGSGWLITGLKSLRIDYAKKSCMVKRYGDYAPWPEKAAGKKCIVNIKTKDDCV